MDSPYILEIRPKIGYTVGFVHEQNARDKIEDKRWWLNRVIGRH